MRPAFRSANVAAIFDLVTGLTPHNLLSERQTINVAVPDRVLVPRISKHPCMLHSICPIHRMYPGTNLEQHAPPHNVARVRRSSGPPSQLWHCAAALILPALPVTDRQP